MGFTLQSLSPSQSSAPFGADALLPFLTSRPPALRTRRSRCPAASGLCSLQGSVPPEPKPGEADALMGFWASPEQFLARRGNSFLLLSLMRFMRPFSEKKGRPALQGLAEHASRQPLAGQPALLRFATRTRPRPSSTKAVSQSVTRPEVRMPFAAPGHPKATCRIGLERPSRRRRRPEGLGGLPPRGISLTPHCQRKPANGQVLLVPVSGSLPHPVGEVGMTETSVPLQGIER
jgi:hypothetical protein